MDTGVFNEDRYFDVFVEYAKADLRRHSDPDHRGESRARSRRAPPAADGLVPQYLVVGQRRARGPACRRLCANGIELDEPQYGRRTAGLAKARPSCCSPRTKPIPAGSIGTPTAPSYAKDGINDYVVHGDSGRRESANAPAPRPPAHYRLTVAAGETATVRLRLTDIAGCADVIDDEFDRIFERRARGSGRVLRDGDPRSDLSDDAKNVMRQSFGGLLWSKQFYHYVVKRLAERRSGQPAAARRTPQRPQPRMGTSLQRRRHLDARQVGVSVVRGLGPGVPLRAAGAGRFGLRQRAADADGARMVHASQRPAAGLRMGFRRRESAGACLGALARLQDREEAPRRRRPRISCSGSSTSCC